MAEWKKEVLQLDEKHTWKAKPGYRIFVAYDGAIRFDVPQDWILDIAENSFKFYDRQPPDDDCTLEVSLIRHSRINWSGLPLAELLRSAACDKPEETIRAEDVRLISRPDEEIAWAETAFIDRLQHRPARSRICLARGRNPHALFTFNFWLDDLTKLDPVWDEVLRSMELGIMLKDPRLGPVTM